MSHWAVILAGGVGSRFWPLSTPQRPKQLLPLAGDEPLLAETVRRLTPLVPAERTLILTSPALAPAVRALLSAIPAANVIAEPRPAGTAPALVWAALEIERRTGGADGMGREAGDAVMISVHADWSVADAEAFRTVLASAADAAADQRSLVTVGVVPSRADPGFGYIQPGEAVAGARRVARFIEKPDAADAERMIGEGYLWNSGIFVWCVGYFLAEVRAHTPEVAQFLGVSDIGRFFTGVTAISVDHGVLERSHRVLVIPGDFGWDDVGTWASLKRIRPLDHAGNATQGHVLPVASRGNVVHAEVGTIVLYGVSDLVVVARDGITLVTTTDRATDLKTLLDTLPADVRDRK